MLLEALAGVSYQEIEADYTVSYANYYGITKEGDPDRYYIIARDLFHPLIAALFDQERSTWSPSALRREPRTSSPREV